ncbi:uncharacterized protein LOC128672292 [Plodia interpunctella]|uniref:uncharacterized protein LOC128672292 n=1 Tax=Plodia interpunctella TaxID=58824 RepID=UPI002367B5D4|nr:uncharacterized protein LOC128672292 [Plodia interpunctella]
MWPTLVLFALFASVQGRAVNISNTWVLPEEGFPVFYRYFRDRISWYEADAVCQFHHANLVTVDTTAQYDAVRAYLKELDISSAVWVGLIRSNPDGDFTWTDYRGLSGDGYWSSAPDSRAAPLCAAADPAADYRWEARACGGPMVASFICELPVPQWALGNEGCMIRALPALTVLYLPESAAVQLTADCGLAGVKRVQCTGNMKRVNLLKELSCAEEEEVSSISNIISTSVTYSAATTDAPAIQDTTSDMTTDDNITTENDDNINLSPKDQNFISTSLPNILKTLTQDNSLLRPIFKIPNKSIMNKNINLNVIHNNNLQSNEIPKIVNTDNLLNKEHLDKLEDEKNMQHKMLHDELARLGNFETIFTQPTDHFVPPLVMARSKLSDDMTVLSLEEKHAQQVAEQVHLKEHLEDVSISHETNNTHIDTTTDNLSSSAPTTTNKPAVTKIQAIENKDILKKDKPKSSVPKKYNEKQFDPKNKISKSEIKIVKTDKVTISNITATDKITTESSSDTETAIKNRTYIDNYQNKSEEEPSIDLTVIIKSMETNKNENIFKGDVPKIEIIENDTTITDPEIKLVNTQNNGTLESQQEISVKIPAQIQNFTMTHEVIKITIINEENFNATPTVFEVTTRMPVFNTESKASSPITIEKESDQTTDLPNFKSTLPPDVLTTTTEVPTNYTEQINDLKLTPITHANIESKLSDITTISTTEKDVVVTESIYTTTTESEKITNFMNNSTEVESNATAPNITTKLSEEITIIDGDEFDKNSTDISETIDDSNSPLLSGANEPIHRPNRSRRPQQIPSRNKFNPFRILG